MKRYFLYFIILFLSNSVFSQQVTIDWDGAKVQDFGIIKKNLPHFKNEGFSYEQNNIFITVKENVGERGLEINNLQWVNISENQLFDLNKHQLPDYEIKGVSYKNVNNVGYAFVRVGLFRFKNNQIQRLSSFSLSPTAKLNPVLGKFGSNNNPLDSGEFYKIKVDKSGIFKITSQFLQSMGINPTNVNPQNFRIYGNGGIMLPEFNQDERYDALQENAIQVIGDEDGVWNDGDYALFYAQGPNGYNLYDTTNGNGYKRTETRTDRSNNFKNIYEDFSYYFINYDKGPGKRVQEIDVNLSSTPITRYDAYQVVNEDNVNLMKLGRAWVDDASFTSPKTIQFNTNSNIQPGDQIRYRTRVIGFESTGNSIAIDINGQNNATISVGSNESFFPIGYNGIISNLQGNSITFNYSPNISGNPNGTFYLDYAEVQYKETLAFNGTQMNFRDFSLDTGSGNNYAFSLSNASNVEQVWDVSDITNANRRVNKSGNSGTFNFGYVANQQYFNNEFVAFRADAAFEPTFVGKIGNQNLQALNNVDYLILTQPTMFGQAQRLANYHEANNNYNVEIVDINQIYNEYSSGGKDITAIRDFVTDLNSPSGTLKYVFILGDTTYDYKDRIPNNFNIVPSYQSEESGSFAGSFVTDDYFVMTAPQTNPNLPSNLPDLPIGRIPAANVSEAQEMMDKVLAYYNALPGQSSPFGIWRMKMDYVVDDDADGGQPFHNYMNEALVQTFELPTTDKSEYNIRKLYLDSFVQQSSAGGPVYPAVNQAINNDVGNSLFLFYFGHGGINGWAQERVLTANDIQNFNNFSPVYSRFPVVSTITCEFTHWDEPNIFSAGEQFIKKEDGGTSAMITSSRALSVGYGIAFTEVFIETLFQLYADDFETLGKAHLLAKNNFGPTGQHLKVNFLGDPAMKMSRPNRNLVIDNIITPVPGVISALDFVRIEGHVNLPGGGIDNSFNGKAAVNIYDKKLNKTTLNNDGNLTPVLNYVEEGSAIVKASGDVVNGQFVVEFYVPQSINYTMGQGRILAYADNNVRDVFNGQPYQIGGINPNGIDDEQPPKAKLYMNNVNFANGGITDQNPLFLACVTDDTGINSSGAGIGHDITVYLDGQIINTIVLNDFYNSGEGFGCADENLKDYQKGYVTYPFRDLEPGEHTLTFKVWDINNNSTTETLNFVVKEETEEQFTINRLLNWPNPFTNKTYIQFEHNCDDILEVHAQIYTITGKLVRTINRTITAEPFLEGFRTPRQAIEWDGKDDFGDNVAKGTYIFKVFARSQNQEKCKGSATAVEKMVLLK